MYKVHIQKISDKLKLLKESNRKIGDAKDANGLLYDAIKKNGNGNYANAVQKRDVLVGELKRFHKVPTEKPSFLYYCLTNPVMTIHHVFLGSFGLFVIVVGFDRNKFPFWCINRRCSKMILVSSWQLR